MSEHTPGPWREGVEGNQRVYGPDGRGGDSGLVATVFRGRGNVRLIAAAPDLLAALYLAAEALDNYSDVDDGDDGQPVANRAMSALQAVEAAIAKAEGK